MSFFSFMNDFKNFILVAIKVGNDGQARLHFDAANEVSDAYVRN